MASSLPPAKTPLNQHSLKAFEQWLEQLGASRDDKNPCRWTLEGPSWITDLFLEEKELRVIWTLDNSGERHFRFPYGLSRADVEAAIQAGP